MGPYTSDLIHGSVVLLVAILATVYATIGNDHSNNIWAVYSACIAYAAGRAGVAYRGSVRRSTDEVTPVTGN